MKKGFTLIELLSVIVLLGMIILIIIPVVDKVIKENKEDLYQTNIKMIEAGARNWASENILSLPDEEGEYVDLTICDLEMTGFLEIDVKNPKTEELFYKDSYVRITKSAYGYEYDYIEEGSTLVCAVCSASTTPIGQLATGQYLPGEEYVCTVKPGTQYGFFVLSRNKDKDSNITSINFIMDSNINSDGEPVKSGAMANKGYVPWLSLSDYKKAGGASWGTYDVITKGPITALNYLNLATSDWVNIPNLNTTYTDLHYSVQLTGKARLPEFGDFECQGPCGDKTYVDWWWMSGVHWIMDSSSSIYGYTSSKALIIDSSNSINSIVEVDVDRSNVGVRPVITVPIDMIKNN